MNFIKKNAYLLIAVTVSSLMSCNEPSTEKAHTVVSGTMSIVVDETVTPIIEDQLVVFESTYTDADITLVNVPENVAVNSLLNDSARVAVLARTLTDGEKKFFEEKSIIPKIKRFATDGLALIANEAYTDSALAVEEVLKVMKGEPSVISTLVFDNPNSSTVRLLKEMALVKDLPATGVYALRSNAEVIKYVYEHPHAVGIVGINWLTQPDPELISYVDDLKVLGIKNQPGKEGDDGYYKPTQSNLALGKYALARDLYIIDCQGVRGLGLGFSAFLGGERGQRIILKSGLLPDSIPPREINIRK